MALLLLAAFIGVPLIEIAVFIEVGGRIGLWPTLAIIILTAVVGTFLLRLQGLMTLRRAQQALDRGELPLKEVFDGACLLVAGVLLLTPGFITDAMGVLLFLPGVRALLRRLLAHRLRVHVAGGPAGRTPDDDIIEGEWQEVRPQAPPDRRLSDDDDEQRPG